MPLVIGLMPFAVLTVLERAAVAREAAAPETEFIKRREGTEDAQHAEGQGRAGHRRGRRHRPRDGAAGGQGRRQRRGQRPGRRGRRRGRRQHDAGAEGLRRDQGGRRQGRAQRRQRRRSGRRRAHGQDRGRELRQDRRRHQQCRHPARPHLPSHEPCRLEDGDRRAPERRLQRQPRRRQLLQGAEVGRLRALHLDLGPGRQFRPGELLGGQDGHHRPVALDRARHGGVQRPLQLHLAVRLDAHDRHHPRRHRRAEGAPRALQEDDAGQDRADGGVPAVATPPTASPRRSSACA